MIRAASVRIKDSTASSETVGMVARIEHAIKAKGESMSPHRRVILRHELRAEPHKGRYCEDERNEGERYRCFSETEHPVYDGQINRDQKPVDGISRFRTNSAANEQQHQNRCESNGQK